MLFIQCSFLLGWYGLLQYSISFKFNFFLNQLMVIAFIGDLYFVIVSLVFVCYCDFALYLTLLFALSLLSITMS